MPVRRYFDLLAKYLRPERGRIVILISALASAVALQLVSPQILAKFIDAAASSRDVRDLVLLAALFTGLSVLRQLLSAVGRYLSESVAWTATNHLRHEAFAHSLSLDLSFHKKHTPGELVQRIDGDVGTLMGFFSQLISGVLVNLALIVGLTFLLFRVDWRIGAIVLSFSGMTLFALWRLRDLAIPRWKAFGQEGALFFGNLTEWLTATEDIRSNGAAPHVMGRFHKAMRQWYPLLVRAGWVRFTMMSLSIVMFESATAGALAAGAYLYATGTATLGTVYLVYSYTKIMTAPIEGLRTQLQDLQRASASIQRVDELLNTKSLLAEPTPSAQATVLPDTALRVAFHNVCFSYEEDQAVLHDVDFDLAAGQSLGLLGRTGSGKTTVARLLFRLYDPQTGSIELGGIPLAHLPLTGARRRVGMVTQDVQIFHASVRDNLTLFRGGAPDSVLTAVLEDVGLGPWLHSLANGLDTVIGSGGAGLSAGQAQLLAFGRLFLNNPGLVILDEASSRLDPITEVLLEKAVGRVLSDRTAIVIAHRLSTVNRVDNIAILDNGRIIEYGRRAVLAADPTSHFNRLLQAGLEEVLV